MSKAIVQVLQRLQKANAPDRELDKAIGEFLIEGEQYKSIVHRGGDYCIRYYPGPPGPDYLMLPRYTTAIDAALKLLPADCLWASDFDGRVSIMRPGPNGTADGTILGTWTGGKGKTPTAIAICCAALMARLACGGADAAAA